jgi:hypothetical protein
MNTATKTAAEPGHICPTHLVRLSHLLKGGAGFCSSCNLFVQAAGVPMPALSAEVAAKRAGAAKPKTKTKTKAVEK